VEAGCFRKKSLVFEPALCYKQQRSISVTQSIHHHHHQQQQQQQLLQQQQSVIRAQERQRDLRVNSLCANCPTVNNYSGDRLQRQFRPVINRLQSCSTRLSWLI